MRISKLFFCLMILFAAKTGYSAEKVVLINEGMTELPQNLAVSEGLAAAIEIENICGQKDQQRQSYISYLEQELKNAGYTVEIIAVTEDNSRESIMQNNKADIYVNARWTLMNIKKEYSQLTMDIVRTYDAKIVASEKKQRFGQFVWHKEERTYETKETTQQKAREQTAAKVLMAEDGQARKLVEWLKENF